MNVKTLACMFYQKFERINFSFLWLSVYRVNIKDRFLTNQSPQRASIHQLVILNQSMFSFMRSWYRGNISEETRSISPGRQKALVA